MPSFWSSMRWIFGGTDNRNRQQEHSYSPNISTACFTGRSKPSVLDIQATKQSAVKIQAINYEAQRFLIDDDAGYCKLVELHWLKNKDLDSLINFCQENEPTLSRPLRDDSGNRFPVNRFPVTWPELLNLHWYWWDRKNQPKSSSLEPTQIDQPPLARNYPEDHETRTTMELLENFYRY